MIGLGDPSGALLPNLTATETALLITAVGSFLIGAVSILVNRKGAQESRQQQAVANELERRSQGYDEMRAIAQERAADLQAAREEHRTERALMQQRIDGLREENRLLRELTRAQVALAEENDLIMPMRDEGPDDAFEREE